MSAVALIYIFLTALFAALLMVPFLQRWGTEQKMVDLPDDERKVHRHAVPRLGGIAICLSFVFAILINVDVGQVIRGVLAGALIILVTGLVDDLYGISPKRKFFGEICAVVTTMVVGHLYVETLGNVFGGGELLLPFWISVPVTIFATVGVINAFNLIDGLDGLAGGVSVITLAAFALLAYFTGNRDVLILCAALLGGIVGFLKYNFYPARIFMGDAGSLVVGFVISFLAVGLIRGGGTGVPPVVLLVIIGLPVADTIWVMARRVVGGRSPFVGDRTHVHHKFLDLGFEHRYTVILIYGISLCCAAIAVVFRHQPEGVLLLGYLVLSIVFYAGIRWLGPRRHLLGILGNDSVRGIRESVTYRWLADQVAGSASLLHLYLLAYLGLGASAAFAGGGDLLKIITALILACGGLLFLTRDRESHFFQALYYAAAMVITFVVTSLGWGHEIYGFSLCWLGDLLLLGMALLVLLRFIFRVAGEFSFTSLDYLLLGLSLFLMVVAPQIADVINLTGVLVRGIVVFTAIKVVTVQGKAPARLVAYSLLGTLLVMAVRLYLG